jgi:hypothetical protein
MTWLGLLLLFAAPFWEATPPADWSEDQLRQMFGNSPWAQPLNGPANAPVAAAYFATASPMEQAERERDRRYKRKRPSPGPDPLAEEYRAWLEENRATQVVLAIPIGDPRAFTSAPDTQRMEEECVMKIGRKKIKMTGHFPPSPDDPYLRLAFPRVATAADKSITFELYLPGIALPFRSVEFRVREMIVKGKLEM